MPHTTSPTPRWLIGLLCRVRRIFPRTRPKMGIPFFQNGLTRFQNRAYPFFKLGLPIFPNRVYRFVPLTPYS